MMSSAVVCPIVLDILHTLVAFIDMVCVGSGMFMYIGSPLSLLTVKEMKGFVFLLNYGKNILDRFWFPNNVIF